MSYKNSCYVNGSYPLLLFLLMKAEGNLDDTFFFFGRGVPENIAKNFKNSWHLNTYFKKKNKLIKYLEMYLLYRNLEKFLIKEELINKDIYMQDDVSYSQFFLNHINKCYLLENGLANYKENILFEANKRFMNKNKIKIFRDKILKRSKYRYKIFGLSNKIEKIYLTGIEKVPKIIESKTIIIDLKQIWDKLSYYKKQEILKIFNFEDLGIINKLNNKILLITQPLSEDGIITEKEKIKIYKEITSKYKDENIVIKRHPREKTEYKKYFPNSIIIEKQFPLEILMLLNVKFTEVVTLFSTAALNFKEITNVNFVGTEKYFKLKKEYGDIKKVYYKI